MAIVKRFGVDFTSEGGALTLDAHEVTADVDMISIGEKQTRTHPDGWTISGVVSEAFYCWVSEFEATHPIYGRVAGNFEEEVYADSEEGFDNFMEHHAPKAWDYENI